MAQIEEIIRAAKCASIDFEVFDQEQVDLIVTAVYRAALEHRVRLAELAHEETGLGTVHDKVLKNVIASQLTYEHIRQERTAGVISENDLEGITEIARPLGPIVATIPVTNPTATTIAKALICLKTRNPVVISPHNAAKRSIAAAAQVCYEAARAAGAPDRCIQWLDKSSPKTTSELMSHSSVALILATGSSSLVKAAYDSGHPVLGVGPGNVPVCISPSAGLPAAIRAIMLSKTFDNGTICASEQALVVPQAIDAEVRAEFEKHGGHFLNRTQCERLAAAAIDSRSGTMSPAVVGQSALAIAAAAKLDLPPETKLLLAPESGVGPGYPLSAEILAPILSYFVEQNFESAVGRCAEILYHGGMGHTAVLHSNSEPEIRLFAQRLPAGRVLINMPAAQGALGGVFSRLPPSFSLACGSGGNNYLTDNISSRHLLNLTRVARLRPNQSFLRMAESDYLDKNRSARALEDAYNNKG